MHDLIWYPLVFAVLANIVCLISYVRICGKKYEWQERQKELDSVERWLDKRAMELDAREDRIISREKELNFLK